MNCFSHLSYNIFFYLYRAFFLTLALSCCWNKFCIYTVTPLEFLLQSLNQVSEFPIEPINSCYARPGRSIYAINNPLQSFYWG